VIVFEDGLEAAAVAELRGRDLVQDVRDVPAQAESLRRQQTGARAVGRVVLERLK